MSRVLKRCCRHICRDSQLKNSGEHVTVNKAPNQDAIVSSRCNPKSFDKTPFASLGNK
jgi:hypothetical protein